MPVDEARRKFIRQGCRRPVYRHLRDIHSVVGAIDQLFPQPFPGKLAALHAHCLLHGIPLRSAKVYRNHGLCS